MRKIILFLFLFLFAVCAQSQVVYEPVSNNAVYDFLDELASLRIISINSIIKPYSRGYIAEKLREAQHAMGDTGRIVPERVRKETEFFLRDYGFEYSQDDMEKKNAVKSQRIGIDPPGYVYRSHEFSVSVRPAVGSRIWINENNSAFEISGGGELFGYAFKHLGYYANVKQTWQNEEMVNPLFFTPEDGLKWKTANGNGVSNTEWRGGLSVSWNWGDLGVYKDRPVWGNSEHGSNILSGHAPSFPFIQLHLHPAKWIEFRYIHGWLQSNVVDSSRSTFVPGDGSGGAGQIIYQKKYIAANMLTVTPWRGLDLSVGNSIIYSDINPNPWYLIPVLFYNSVDAEKNSYDNNNGSNSQMFIDVCSRQIRHVALYGSLFIDELKVSRITDPAHYNFTSWKLGVKLSDLVLRNTSFTLEWTKTNPVTYKHFIPSLNYTSEEYTLGHYMRDNAEEIYCAVTFKPLKNLTFLMAYTYAIHGGEYAYTRDKDPTAYPVLKDLTWQNNEFQLACNYQIFNRVNCYIRYINSSKQGDVQYEPAMMHGKTNTMIAGISLGF